MARLTLRHNAFVGSVIVLAAVAYAAAWQTRMPFPGWWPLATFLVAGALLDGLRTSLRASASGSVVFVMHLAGALLFGPFWGAVVAGASNCLVNLSRGSLWYKVLFNLSQFSLAIFAGSAAYGVLGGEFPPAFLVEGNLRSIAVQRDLGLFFVMACGYFLVNSLAVSTAVALGSDRAFREVWNWNNRGVLGYDFAASTLAMLVAWLYAQFDVSIGFGSIGLVVVVFPLVAVRHVYGLYRQLQESGQELLQVMVKAIEARDPYTSGHSVRVSRLSRTIAVELGLPANDVEQIETAALLHDVGKIHEEFAPLLRKETRLDNAETALMQTHAARSADLVGIISKFRGSVQEAVRRHHERWDGRGYPDGLSGDTIPVAARIILISDTIDAMTTDRPYRRRLPLEVVIAELQKCRGTQFDPRIVDVAISSVAVRHLIATPSLEVRETQPQLLRRRPVWASASIWRTRRA